MEPNKPVFENFKTLKSDMIRNGWIIDAFDFSYKKNHYIVLVELFEKSKSTTLYALLKIQIYDSKNMSNNIEGYVNSNGFIGIETKDLRELFNIEYRENLGDILKQFNQYFAKFIPTQVNPNKLEILKNAIIYSLSKNDSEDPNKKFCYMVRRNPDNQSRTPFNDNKTKILRPELYNLLGEDKTISFCYSLKEKDEKSDAEIILSFSNRK